jgi:hypothetical protein
LWFVALSNTLVLPHSQQALVCDRRYQVWAISQEASDLSIETAAFVQLWKFDDITAAASVVCNRATSHLHLSHAGQNARIIDERQQLQTVISSQPSGKKKLFCKFER